MFVVFAERQTFIPTKLISLARKAVIPRKLHTFEIYPLYDMYMYTRTIIIIIRILRTRLELQYYGRTGNWRDSCSLVSLQSSGSTVSILEGGVTGGLASSFLCSAMDHSCEQQCMMTYSTNTNLFVKVGLYRNVRNITYIIIYYIIL